MNKSNNRKSHKNKNLNKFNNSKVVNNNQKRMRMNKLVMSKIMIK
jgi:hypothetical protein